MRLAGIMTGTSLDAMDLAICTIRSEAGRESITLDAFWSAPYPDEVRYLIFRALRGEASMKELSAIPYELATAFARELRAHKATVDAIGVHGQTLWHDPPRSTWQAVSGPALAVQTATPVVHDFRSADVALGGQGAPLVPMFDLAFLHSQTIDRVAVNIGGMANCTLLPKDVDATTVRAFDTGPGNVLIDAACRSTFGKRFDEGGSFARAGRVIDDLLKELQQHPFFSAEPPKSTGREVFNDVMVEDLHHRFVQQALPAEDFVATLTELTAWSIADHLTRYLPSATEIVVSGGGVHNSYLMERLASHLPQATVMSSHQCGVDPDAKEAMCFAYLAWRTLQGLPGNLPSVTGARAEAVLGSVARPLP